jgi:hypothetical protein
MATVGGNLMQRTRCYYFYDTATPCNKRAPGTGCSAIHGFNRIHAILGTSEQCIAVHPSDMCVALAALEAIVRVTGPDGDRAIPFADFHRLPGHAPHLDTNLRAGEIITSVDLPAEDFAEHHAYLKVRDRQAYAFALVSVAAALQMEVARSSRPALPWVAWRTSRGATAVPRRCCRASVPAETLPSSSPTRCSKARRTSGTTISRSSWPDALLSAPSATRRGEDAHDDCVHRQADEPHRRPRQGDRRRQASARRSKKKACSTMPLVAS